MLYTYKLQYSPSPPWTFLAEMDQPRPCTVCCVWMVDDAAACLNVTATRVVSRNPGTGALCLQILRRPAPCFTEHRAAERFSEQMSPARQLPPPPRCDRRSALYIAGTRASWRHTRGTRGTGSTAVSWYIASTWLSTCVRCDDDDDENP